MSGIAGIVRFDGAPVEPGSIERMTAAMAHRGPDGIRHWSSGSVALGQCMLCTTPESLDERGPLANEDGSLVLVMDGRVDNWEELRRELLGRGAVLRDRTDAELVLRAYEVWGRECPDRIVGELAFFVWDARRQRLFGARDPAGTHHFYFHTGNGWFGFASEIGGLLATGLVDARLNEARLLDYLVSDFDRDDEIGTFYQGVERLPAGHAMEITARGPKTWRWWDPSDLPELPLRTLEEYAEAFVDQLRVAVKCRLRSTGRVGAMLSGGLDSSSIVGLIRKEFRDELREPLRTYSLIRQDRENCSDWRAIREMLEEGWIEPTIITSDAARLACRSFFEGVGEFDEPFGPCQSFTDDMIFQAAQRDGCKVVLDGVAGDLHFYSARRSLGYVVAQGKPFHVPEVLASYRRHGLDRGASVLARMAIGRATPRAVKASYRRFRKRGELAREARKELAGDVRNLLRPEIAYPYLARKIAARRHEAVGSDQPDRRLHARAFMSGTLSFAYEAAAQVAAKHGLELRGPYSDRRLIELSIRLPAAAKLASGWYKRTLREGMGGILPEGVRWRRSIGDNPAWTFRERIISQAAHDAPDVWQHATLGDTLKRWVDSSQLAKAWKAYERSRRYETGLGLFTLAVLAQWLTSRFPKHAHIPRDVPRALSNRSNE
jgi:asparagine synthase (glutamine-hydrolysing)